jgi:hypothetical protein
VKLRIFTLVFRNVFLEMLEHCCANSLAWPRNIAALKSVDATWHIYSREDERDRINGIVTRIGIPVEHHAIPDIHAIAEKLDTALLAELRAAVEGGSALLTAQPDIVFGDGTIETFIALAKENNEVCIAAPHPRVNAAEFIKEIGAAPIENSELVRLAFKHLHESWRTADLSLDKVSCWHGGVAWRRLGDKMYGVTARLPTAFLVRPREDDIAFFSTAKKGAWDHHWPTKLVNERRQRLIGSSDAAFVVELTEASSHPSVLRAKLPNKQDIYRHNNPHNEVNANTMAIWRSA